jgi:hypothetical protein
MTENLPELSSSCRSYEATTPVVAQGKTSNNWTDQDLRCGNPLVERTPAFNAPVA